MYGLERNHCFSTLAVCVQLSKLLQSVVDEMRIEIASAAPARKAQLEANLKSILLKGDAAVAAAPGKGGARPKRSVSPEPDMQSKVCHDHQSLFGHP